MAHYYFDIKSDVSRRDHVGADFDSDCDAIRRGRAIAEHAAFNGQDLHASSHVSIICGDGREVMQVKVASRADQASAPRLKKSAQ